MRRAPTHLVKRELVIDRLECHTADAVPGPDAFQLKLLLQQPLWWRAWRCDARACVCIHIRVCECVFKYVCMRACVWTSAFKPACIGLLAPKACVLVEGMRSTAAAGGGGGANKGPCWMLHSGATQHDAACGARRTRTHGTARSSAAAADASCEPRVCASCCMLSCLHGKGCVPPGLCAAPACHRRALAPACARLSLPELRCAVTVAAAFVPTPWRRPADARAPHLAGALRGVGGASSHGVVRGCCST